MKMGSENVGSRSTSNRSHHSTSERLINLNVYYCTVLGRVTNLHSVSETDLSDQFLSSVNMNDGKRVPFFCHECTLLSPVMDTSFQMREKLCDFTVKMLD